MYRSHVLVCGGTGCTSSGSAKIIEEFEKEIAATGLTDEVRVVRTGCFGLCALGPVVIIYPEGSFYSRVQPEDVKEIVDAYLADERCTFRFTVNGYYNLFTSIEEAGKQENLERMPKDLPVLFMSGAEDPVGGFGKGVEQVRRQFEAAGMQDVTWILYENDRHEIVNETDRETVLRDLYAWLYVRASDPRRENRRKMTCGK